jgi:hypothetical protein
MRSDRQCTIMQAAHKTESPVILGRLQEGRAHGDAVEETRGAKAGSVRAAAVDETGLRVASAL